MSRPVDLVLFDFGGVFTDSPFFAVDGLARDLGVDIQQFAELMFGAYHLDTDHPWPQLERGEITFDHAREEILALGKASGMAVDPMDLLVRMAGGKIELAKFASDLLEKPDHSEFYQTCGDGFVSAIHRGSKIYLVLTQRYASRESRESLSASISASVYGASRSGSSSHSS